MSYKTGRILEEHDLVPAHIAQLVRALDLKARGCGFDSRAGQPTIELIYVFEVVNIRKARKMV